MKKILVIEDEEVVRTNILELLDAENFEALEASNGLLGIQLAQKNLPDLIICDIMMPNLDGYAVLAALRSEPMTATIPLIFLTAKDDRSSTRKGMELGADDYLTKPCTANELLKAISIRLEKHAAYKQQYAVERERAKGLQQRVRELQQVNTTAEDLLHSLSQELRDPLSNITMAIQMLKIAPTEEARTRYLKILQEECAREIAIINQLANLQDLLTPENVKLLSRINFIRTFNSNSNSSL
ncbi:MAG: response regulator [Microcoleus vaginatus WJT46-NPBG5]|jgi:DNA-binding response OmpR family regulator|nr:response regulator [Microcoleus vaginatus WJT46-NPBG5]